MKQSNLYKIAALVVLIVIVSYVPLFLKESTMNIFVREDGLYEAFSPIYLAVVAVMFGIAFFRSPARIGFKDRGLQKLSYLGFTILFTLAAFEEISWGQRIINFATPNFMEDANAQNEFTLHNLKFFQGDDAVFPLDFDQLAAGFALALGLLIPVACAAIPPLNAFLRPKIPILPVQLSIAFALNYLIQKAAVRLMPLLPELYHNTTRKLPAVVHEIREHNYALLLMVAAILFVVFRMDQGKTESEVNQLPGS